MVAIVRDIPPGLEGGCKTGILSLQSMGLPSMVMVGMGPLVHSSRLVAVRYGNRVCEGYHDLVTMAIPAETLGGDRSNTDACVS